MKNDWIKEEEKDHSAMVGEGSAGSEGQIDPQTATFQDIDQLKQHRFKLSYETVDKVLLVPIWWSFSKFLQKVSVLFPQLQHSFMLMDSVSRTVDEGRFDSIKQSTSEETWLLLRKGKEDNNNREEQLEAVHKVLKKPRYELLKYDVHPNALTQSGSYHFSECYQAFCEFVDNAIQATSKNSEEIGRIITIHIYLKHGIARIFDNGAGMSGEGLHAFASYFLSQEDRGIEPGTTQTFGFMDGNISKFGVGATQAGFYLGETIKVVTKNKESPFVTEIAISKEKLHARAKHNLPVFEDYKCMRNPGDTSTLDEHEMKCLVELVEREVDYDHFTAITIKKVEEKHLRYLFNDDCASLSRNLAHVYHYYLHGIQGRLKKLEFDRMSLKSFKADNKPKVSVKIFVDKATNVQKVYDLREVKDDLESQYQIMMKDVFSFCLELKIPEVKDTQIVQGCLMYFPNESGEESLPEAKHFYREGSTPDPMFECFWQGRLAPLSYVNNLSFCARPDHRTRKQKDQLPDVCYQRVRGVLFFNRFTPISNNKLKILLDTRRDLSDVMGDASGSRRLPKDFQQWLEKCHRQYDRELIYEEPLPTSQQPNNGDMFYGRLRIIHAAGEECYTSGDQVKLDTRPVVYGKAMYFIKKGKPTELDEIIYCRLPEEVYGGATEARPVMRLVGKPDQATLDKVFHSDMLLLPKTIEIHEGSDTLNEVVPELEFYAGEDMKERTHYWVTVFNGENPPKAMTELYQKKIGVKVEVTDITLNTLVQNARGVAERSVQSRYPLINQVHIDKRFGFKPFFLHKEGVYEVKFSVLLANNPCMVEKKLEMRILPNVAEIVNLLENSPDKVQLGEPCISFILSFHDVYENNTNLFKNGSNAVKIQCSCQDLVIKGLEKKYKPGTDGKLEVKGLSVEPDGTQLSLNRDYEFWVIAEGIGDVMFPFRLLTGPPERVQTTQLESLVFENYETFPEFEVKLLDKWDQPAIVQDKSVRLALSCEAFSQMILLSSIAHSRAKFPMTPIRVENLSEVTVRNVFVSLVIPDNQKKKNIIKKTLKELFCMQIQITPSNVCEQIKIIKVGDNESCVEDFLGIQAVAGSVVSGLKVVAFSQGGEKLTDEQFLAQEPKLMCTWAEVNTATLPMLPDCPVTNIIQVNVHNVQCFYKYNGFEIRNEAKLRISVLPGEATKWSLDLVSPNITADEVGCLQKSLKIIVLDRHHNRTTPMAGVNPFITAEHTSRDCKANYSGELELNNDEFLFSPASILNGTVGRVTLSVQDEQSVLSKDSVKVDLLHGKPVKVFATCTAFESSDSEIPVLRMFSNQPINAHLMCYIVDNYGNQSNVNSKAVMTLEWFPPSAGMTITKKASIKGEAIFQGNVIKCISGTGDVKIKISCADMPNLEPFWVSVQVLQCNRVVIVHMEVSDRGLKATTGYPTLKISHTTEDGVHLPNILPRLKVNFYKPNSKPVDIKAVYPKEKRRMEDELAIFEPAAQFEMQEAGSWDIQCQYTETRQEIKQFYKENIVSSNTVNLKVIPGVTRKFKVNLPEASILFASNTEDINARTLIPIQSKGMGYPNKVELLAVDEYGNVSGLDSNVYLIIESAEKESRDDIILPELEKSCQLLKIKGGKLLLPRISLKPKIGNEMGSYILIITNHEFEPCKINFSFSTDVEVEQINNKMIPLKAELDKFQNYVKEKQEVHKEKKTELCSLTLPLKKILGSAEPKIRDIDIRINQLRSKENEFECLQRNIRKGRKDEQYPPHNVRQYIKGLVCELAYVTDENHCRILSWYAQGKMKVALCETKEQQKKVYDLGCPAYSQNLIFGFHKKGYDPDTGNVLPIDLPKPPASFRGSMHCAVNLLEFKEENKYLRASLYWSVFNRTIVVEDIEQAQKYREHCVKMKQPCPAILTLHGDLLASDGLMDPGRRCPKKLDQLRFTFSEMPPKDRADYCELKDNIEKIEKIRRVSFELNVIGQEVQQCQLNLTTKQKSIMPLIRVHEEKLNSLKRKAESIKNESKKKRKT